MLMMYWMLVKLLMLVLKPMLKLKFGMIKWWKLMLMLII